jgi:hypothetical protein
MCQGESKCQRKVLIHFFGLFEIQQMLGPLHFFMLIAKYPDELCLIGFHVSHFVLCMVLCELLLHNFSCFVFLKNI